MDVEAGAGRTPEDGADPALVVAERSYRYVRVSMVGVLLALAVAVGYQSARQGGLLDSISAYYYTPAQAIFVGALTGLGVAMIALQGTTDVEDVLLNLGGMVAPVVAVVPTSRGADFEAAVRACRAAGLPAMSGRFATAQDCPTIASLTAATRANVENNMTALLVTGAVALIVTAVFRWAERKSTVRTGPVWGLVAAVLVYAVTAVAFLAATAWFVGLAHYLAAAGLFVSIVTVVVANAVRLTSPSVRAPRAMMTAMMTQGGRWYLALAVAMVVAALVLGSLWLAGVVTLFWLEAVLIALFAVFWVAQTGERWSPPGRSPAWRRAVP